MDILGTKDRNEREEEEAERLVRPLPKLKPPRHDRRREEMQVDRDPDVEGDPDTKSDPDISMNRREIGGSSDFLRRFVREVLAGEAAKKLVTVRRKEDDQTVQVSEDTLHGPDASKYEKIKEGDPKPKKDRSHLQLVKPPKEEAPKGEEAPKEEAPKPKEKPDLKEAPKPKEQAEKPKKEKAKLTDEELAANVVNKWKAGEKHKSPDFQEFGDSIPTSAKDKATGEVLFLDPSSKKRLPFEKLPNAEKARLIQEFSKKKEQAGKEKAEQEKTQKEQDALTKAISSADGETTEKTRKLLRDLADPESEASKKIQEIVSKGHAVEDLDIAKTFPETAKLGQLPPSIKNVADLVRVAKPFKEGDEKREAEEKKQAEEKAKAEAAEAKKHEAPPPPKRKPPTDREKYEAISMLLDNFPRGVASSLVLEHPDDIKSIVTKYQSLRDSAKDIPPETAAAALKHIGPNFTLSPMSVKPPKKLNGKPFAELDQEEKVEAMQRYRMNQIATNLAVRDLAISSLKITGVDSELAAKIADHTISSGSDPKEHRKKTVEASRDLFVSSSAPKPQASEGDDEGDEDERFGVSKRAKPEPTPTPPKARKRLLDGLGKSKNLDAQMLAVSSFQGEDYQEAMRNFRVDPSDSPKKVVAKLKDAGNFFKEQSKLYPSEAVSALEDPYRVFRTRVRHSLSSLSEKDAKVVRKHIAEMDASDYDLASSDHAKALKKYKKDRERWEKAKDKSEKSGKPFTTPEPTEPTPPVKPEDYDVLRRNPKGDPDSVRGRFEEALKKKTAALYSSYPTEDWQMGTTMPSRDQVIKAIRTAIYHGVQPYPAGHEGFAPYTGWEQARIRDLVTQDFSTILAEAKSWLKSPVLSKSIEGMVPDSRFRAALDLAIRDVEGGKYSSAIDANLYNMLLAKLAGESQTETLLTIREAASNRTEGTEMTIKIAKEDANKALSRIDRIAGLIQANAETWSIPFETAKSIVNDLDKTADEIEKSAYGAESLAKRQVEVLKSAKVLQHDSDEGYMGTFNAPTAPKQTDSDEPYMSLFKDDQTVAVVDGKSSTGRPLAP